MTTEPTTPTPTEAGHYLAALHEIAAIVGCGAVYPVDLPGKVRELVEGLRGELKVVEDERDEANLARDRAEATEVGA